MTLNKEMLAGMVCSKRSFWLDESYFPKESARMLTSDISKSGQGYLNIEIEAIIRSKAGIYLYKVNNKNTRTM